MRKARIAPLAGIAVLACFWAGALCSGAETPGGFWPQFRGPNRDLVSTETGLLKSWPAEGPRLLWKATGIGGGFSTVSIAGGRIYTQGHKEGKECVIVLDEATGQVLRTVPVGPAEKVDRPGSRSVPTLTGDLMLVETVAGDVVCLRTATLQEVWRRSLVRDFRSTRRSMWWGHGESPLVDGDRVIVTPGGKEATLVALDRQTGRTLWQAQVPEGDAVMYTSPMAAEVDGVRQYVQFLQGGVVGVRATDGKFLWRNNDSTCERNNISSPLVIGRRVLSSAGYDKGAAALVELQQGGSVARLVYRTPQFKCQLGGFVLVDGHVYGCHDPGALACLELESGKVLWTERSTDRVSITYADGRLYLRGEKGHVILAEATPAGYRERGRFMQPERSKMVAYPYPVVAGGRLYLRDQDNLFCYDVRDPAAR